MVQQSCPAALAVARWSRPVLCMLLMVLHVACGDTDRDEDESTEPTMTPDYKTNSGLALYGL